MELCSVVEELSKEYEGKVNVGKVNVDFFSGPSPSGTYTPASTELVADKAYFGSSRAARWFGKV